LEFEGMTDNWLTPETAIGCRLPCGATVLEAFLNGPVARICVNFDRNPMMISGRMAFGPNGWHFDPDGGDMDGVFPNLIPPTPAQPGVMVTREAAVRAAMKMGLSPPTAGAFADALGIPPDPPKVAPWWAAYDAWNNSAEGRKLMRRDIWQAAVEWCVAQVDAEYGRSTAVHHRIMGDQA
jgi:hypothetical protein